MIHHISIGVSDIVASGSFYDAILQPLGYVRAFEDLRPGERHQAIGYGVAPNEDIFTIKERNSEFLAPGPGFHLAFSAPSCEAIGMWHKRGIEMGAIDKGGPKIWTDFGPNYYAAYLTDPDGWQLEAVLKTTSLERD
ncbi:MAG: VOC family protein [Actinobacteria bacterium]|jgi:catechol 2,3-dioxygenase-like lactoylglutathione lyase family enzyme|nr:VOC family protein [Actinomycetota bacterium]NCW94808.1 VOC family protein [Actinomycetota bacterium]NCX76942.1 VOC family protein [Actinomycetota bacterium]